MEREGPNAPAQASRKSSLPVCVYVCVCVAFFIVTIRMDERERKGRTAQH